MNDNTEFLKLGLKTIDLQHQKFFSLLNELKIYNSNEDNVDTIYDILNELKAYTTYHFKEEAKLMKELEFDEIKPHLEQHAFFIKKLQEFETGYKYESSAFSNQMLMFLQKWFLVHIADSDVKYAEFAKQKNTDLG